MAKLPNFTLCYVPDAKLSDYLLSSEHPDGAAKAKFLKSFGFTRSDPQVLRIALLAHATNHGVADSRQTDFGVIYEVDGEINSPDGRNPFVRVVWTIDSGTDQPRLVTLVPVKDDAR